MSRAQTAIRVWDWPTRVGHLLLILAFAGAWLSSEGERWRLLHVYCGYTLAGVIGFRLLWGVLGSRHARFAAFVRPPQAALAYLGALLRGRPPHYSGHNPAGGLAILLLLALGLLTAASGHLSYESLLPEALDEVHEACAEALLAVVGLHLLGVAVGSLAHRENLVRAMLTGDKAGPPADAIPHSHPLWAALLLAAVLAGWAYAALG
ncbi:MAG: hypothetical protein RIR00_1749 [Pseudomonadota bacterium]|jgi:cytochrome b